MKILGLAAALLFITLAAAVTLAHWRWRTWISFHASHHVTSPPPGFIWDAKIRMAPGLSVMVRDGVVKGKGSMVASVMGLNPAGTAGDSIV